MSAATQLRKDAEAIADATPSVDLPATHVIEALRRVTRDLPAIGRDQTASPSQGGYAYRGIEQITKHTQELFARHGVVFIPRVTAWEIRDIVVNGKPWTDTVLTCEYDVYGPGGTADKITLGPILAIGRDNSDKGANKCMTQAFKYALLQALCISDAKDDADGTSHEADAVEPPVEWNAGMVKAELLNALKGDKAEAKAAWEWASGDDLTEWSAAIAHDIATRWLERPIESNSQSPTSSPDVGSNAPALPLGETE